MHTAKPVHTPSISRTSLTLIDGELLVDPSNGWCMTIFDYD